MEKVDRKDSTNIYVRGFPKSWTKTELDAFFSKYGQILASAVLYSPQTKLSRQVGMIRFAKSSVGEEVINTLNGFTLPTGESLIVKHAKDSGPKNATPYDKFDFFSGAQQYHNVTPSKQESNNVYLCDLPLDLTKESLIALMSPYGKIKSSVILTDSATGKSRGIGFVRFANAEEAQEAIKELNGTSPMGAIKPITVKLASEQKVSSKNVGSGLLSGSHVASHFAQSLAMHNPLHASASVNELGYPLIAGYNGAGSPYAGISHLHGVGVGGVGGVGGSRPLLSGVTAPALAAPTSSALNPLVNPYNLYSSYGANGVGYSPYGASPALQEGQYVYTNY